MERPVEKTGAGGAAAMRRRLFSDSSIFFTDFQRLFDQDLTSSAEICLYDHPKIQEIKQARRPLYRVVLTRREVQARVSAPAGSGLQHSLVQNTGSAEAPLVEGPDRPLVEALLFDASDAGQLMCVGVGRYPHNLLRPYMGEDLDAYYTDPDPYDPGSVCAQISRDHGLVFLDREQNIYFRDFGTKKEGRRAGSKNGTWIGGKRPIRDTVIRWPQGEYLGIGGMAWCRTDGAPVKEHVFKLHYEKLF